MIEIDYDKDNDSPSRQEEERLAKLAAFAGKLVEKRKNAVEGRKNSGIETIWTEDEEHYDCIDDANRNTETILKPTTLEGRPIVRGTNGDESDGSNVFVSITQPYVDMIAARESEMLLPTDDKPFKLGPTPIPEVIDSVDSQEPMPDGQVAIGEAAQAMLEEMDSKAEKAETQIWDWLTESRWHSEVRKVIDQATKIGTGILKGPFPVKRKRRAVIIGGDGLPTLKISDELVPGSKWIDVWNFYPDPSCLDDIRKGGFVWERDYISGKQLRDLKGVPGYLDAEIDEIIKEGPGKCNIDGKGNPRETENYEIWYYHGTAEPDELQAAECGCEDGQPLNVVVTMINDRIIKASLSVFESGEFPYDVMLYQRRSNHWAGIGVARQVRTPQLMVNAATRNLLDNAGVSSGPQIIMRDGIVYPADGEWKITPRKVWRVDNEADIQDVANAITSITIPSMQAELQNIINMALDFAERATSMPLLLQGQQGASTHTVGGMQILQSNASVVMRRIASIADDNVFEPHVSRYYEWLIVYGKDNSMKGDFTIVPQGSSSFYERDAQNQMIMQLLPMAANPEFELDPSKLMKEVLKMNKISPERVSLDEQAIEQRKNQQPPPDPALAVAQFKAQADMEKEKVRQESDMAELQQKERMQQAEMAFKLQELESTQAFQLQMKQMELDVKILELSKEQQLSLDSIKASLASDTMKLQTQKELSLIANRAKQAANPPTEPAGRANVGHAYEQ
jgi:hypothetical protein